MIPFFIGSLLGCTLTYLFAGTLYFSEYNSLEHQPWHILALKLIVLPACVQVFTAEVTARIMRKRHFDARALSYVVPFFVGIGCALLAVAVTAVSLPFVATTLSDSVTIGLAAGVSTIAVVAFMPHTRKGRCVRCDYNLGDPRPARCPECGLATGGASMISVPCPPQPRSTTPPCPS